jgi:hypothetical protein
MIKKLIFIFICLFLSSCSSGVHDNINLSNPKSVAEAYYLAAFDCGEKGAGLQYDLAAKPLPTTRDQWLDYQKRSGCVPRKPQEYYIRTQYLSHDFALIWIESEVHDQIVLVRDGNDWHIDADQSSSLGQRF